MRTDIEYLYQAYIHDREIVANIHMLSLVRVISVLRFHAIVILIIAYGREQLIHGIRRVLVKQLC